MTVNLNTGTVRLVSKKTRVVEVLGPEPPGSRRPTDRELLFDGAHASVADYLRGPDRIGFCFDASGRRATFRIDHGSRGNALLDLLARRPATPVRPVRPYGTKGWLLEG